MRTKYYVIIVLFSILLGCLLVTTYNLFLPKAPETLISGLAFKTSSFMVKQKMGKPDSIQGEGGDTGSIVYAYNDESGKETRLVFTSGVIKRLYKVEIVYHAASQPETSELYDETVQLILQTYGNDSSFVLSEPEIAAQKNYSVSAYTDDGACGVNCSVSVEDCKMVVENMYLF